MNIFRHPSFPIGSQISKSVWVSIVFFGFAISGFAEDVQPTQSVLTGGATAPKAPAPADWKKETEATCGMNCRYSRAGENLSLQAVYLLKKVQFISETINSKPFNAEKEKDVRLALGAFCKSSTEDIQECFKRYKDFQRIGLLEIRNSIGKIDDYKKNLIDGVKPDGTADGVSLVYDVGVEHRGYVPDVPTLQELEKAYQEGNLHPNRGKYSANDIRKWSEELIITDPKARYIQYKAETINGNPYQENKTSYRLYVGDSGADGKFNSIKEPQLKKFDKSQQRVLEFSKDETIPDGQVTAIAPGEMKKKDKITYDALKAARNEINSKIEEDLKPTLVHSKDKNRNPAGDKEEDVKKDQSKEIQVQRNPSSGSKVNYSDKDKNDDYKVVPPIDSNNSRYIKYNVNRLLEDTDSVLDDK